MRNLRRSIGEYPQEWLDGSIQKQVKARANHQCENCGLQYPEDSNYSLNERLKGSCHHIDHNRSNSDLNNIVFLCNRCHLDCHRNNWIPNAELPRQWKHKTPRWIITRNLPYRNSQPKLWSESE